MTRSDPVLHEYYDATEGRKVEFWTWKGIPIKDLDPDELLEALNCTLDAYRTLARLHYMNEDLAKMIGG